MFTKYRFQIYLLCIVLISYWPFTFFTSSLLNDDIDVALATKYFAGTCLQNGYLPLWNPYQIFGFPAHADLQYTNWNLETLLIGITKGYDYYTLHILYLTYLYLGALGMFLLTKYLSKNALVSFYLAATYILSGLFAAHTQSLVTILGLVWMPYVVLYFLKWLENPSLKSSILVSVFAYLFFTLGYQAFAFMLIPIFIALLIVNSYKAIQQNLLQQLKNYTIWGVCILIFVGILFIPVIVSQIQSQPFVARLNGLTLEEVMVHPFSPYGLISFINPILTIGNDELFNTDVCMRNLFIGLIPAMLLLISLFKKNKTMFEYILLFFGVLFLLASFGDYTPIRKILYYSFPGFKLFRFPSLIKSVAYLCWLMYLAMNLKFAINYLYTNKKWQKAGLLFLILSSSIVSLVAFYKSPAFSFFDLKNETFNARVTKSSPYEIAFYYGLIQLVFLIGCFFILKSKISFRHFCKQIFILSIVELCFTLFIYGQYVTFSSIKPSAFQENFSKLTTNFPKPSEDAINNNLQKFDDVKLFWKNTGCFKKQAMPYDEWTSFLFSKYNHLSDHYPYLKDSLYNYPFIYFSKELPHEKPIAYDIDSSLQSVTNTFHFKNSQALYKCISYKPEHIVIACASKNDVILNLQQTYYTGWSATINNQEAPLLWNASLLMSVKVPKGTHIIEFKYHNPTFEKSIIISYTSLVGLLFLLIWISSYNSKTKSILSILLASLVSIILICLHHNTNRNHETKNTFTLSNNNISIELNSKADYRNLWQLLKKQSPKTINYSWKNFYNSPEFLYTLNYNYDSPTLSVNSGSILCEYSTTNNQQVLFKENITVNYPNKQFIDCTNANYALIIEGKNNPYAFTQTIDPSKLKDKNIYGTVTVKSTPGSNLLVACFIKDANNVEEQLYFSLNKYLIQDNTFQTIPYYFNTKNKIKHIKEISLFLMNQNEQPCLLKEFKGVCFN